MSTTTEEAKANVGLAFGLVIAAGLSTTIGAAVVFFSSIMVRANKQVLAISLGFSAGTSTVPVTSILQLTFWLLHISILNSQTLTFFRRAHSMLSRLQKETYMSRHVACKSTGLLSFQTVLTDKHQQPAGMVMSRQQLSSKPVVHICSSNALTTKVVESSLTQLGYQVHVFPTVHSFLQEGFQPQTKPDALFLGLHVKWGGGRMQL